MLAYVDLSMDLYFPTATSQRTKNKNVSLISWANKGLANICAREATLFSISFSFVRPITTRQICDVNNLWLEFAIEYFFFFLFIKRTIAIRTEKTCDIQIQNWSLAINNSMCKKSLICILTKLGPPGDRHLSICSGAPPMQVDFRNRQSIEGRPSSKFQ